MLARFVGHEGGMIPAENHGDVPGPRRVGKLVSPLGIASHGADAHQVRAAEIGRDGIDGFVDQRDLGIQLRRDQGGQRGEGGRGIAGLGVGFVPAAAVVEAEGVGGDQQDFHGLVRIPRAGEAEVYLD